MNHRVNTNCHKIKFFVFSSVAVTAFFRCYAHQYFLALQGLVLAPILILFDLLFYKI